jgi:glucan phosphoethanolaminetransferase (alkaline phosphatase superfamily)
MYKRTFVRAASIIGLESIVWLTAPLIFLSLYVRYSVASTAAITPHLLILLLIFLLLGTLRVSLALWVNGHWITRSICALLYATVFLFELLYYPLVLIGINAWGQVISWDLIRSYALQSPALADALGISLSLSLVTLFGFCLAVLGLAWWYVGRMNWPQALATSASKHLRTRALIIALIGVFSVCGLILADVFITPLRDTTEPIVTTFFLNNGVRAFRGFAIDAKGGGKLDRESDAARARYQPNDSASKKNLILIVVDALRPDHLGVYGYARDTTPHLNRIATSPDVKVRLAHGMRAICSESACGLFGIASSRYFHEVSARAFTLQQVLQAHSYDIHMILGGDHTNFYGLRSLYGKVDSFVDGSDSTVKYANSDRWVIDKTKELPDWNGKPTMIQFHLMSAHPLGEREAAFEQFLPTSNYSLTMLGRTIQPEHATNFYDNGVLRTDDVVNQLLQTLAAKKYLENSLVVITGDHGEALGEHGLFSHAKGVREAGIRIPLILLSYGYDPPPISADHVVATSQVDIAPTILREFGMPIPDVWRGMPLQLPFRTDIQYVQQGDEVGLVDARFPPALWKYWIRSRTGQEFAFDLAIDPGEHNNVLRQRNGVAPALVRDWRMRTRQLRPVADGR